MSGELQYVRFRLLRKRGLTFVVQITNSIEELLRRHPPKPITPVDPTATSATAKTDKAAEAPKTDDSDEPEKTSEFDAIYEAFWDNLGRLIKAMPEAQSGMAIGAHAVYQRELEGFLRKRGTPIGKPRRLFGTYAINKHDTRILLGLIDAHTAQASVVRGLPNLLVPTVVAHYDAFISKIMLTIFKLKPDLTKSINKDISFAELVKFSSIEEATRAVVDREVESVMRGSHLDQISWLSKKFGTKLEPEPPLRKAFCELTERRNVIIHNDGFANDHYIGNCLHEGVDLKGAKVGEKLNCDAEYLTSALAHALEMATKIHQVLWRKFFPKEQPAADRRINDITFELILARKYAAAVPLFDFCREDIKTWSSEELRLINVVNHANLLRLQKKDKQSDELLAKEDWTTKTAQFQICVAAVRRDTKKAIEILKTYGKALSVSAADFVHWPVFWELVKQDEFLASYKDVFGEELFSKPTTTETSGISNDEGIDS